MQEITLNILAQDILETDYSNGEDCAITRAINRVGNGQDFGFLLDINGIDFNSRNSNYMELSNRVCAMYAYANPEEWSLTIRPEEPKDFSFTLKMNSYEDIT